jgi:hypothetical protein
MLCILNLCEIGHHFSLLLAKRLYPPSSLIFLLLEEVHTQKDTDEVEMSQNIEYLHSDIFSVLAKEKELRGDGYRSKNLIDESLLELDEYLVRAPIRKSSSAHIGWHYKSIIWRTS